MRKTQNTAQTGLYRLAGVFALLFFMAGGDGQLHVQAVFLLLSGACLLAAEFMLGPATQARPAYARVQAERRHKKRAA